MKKNVKRINESQLRAIVAESVKKVLNEGGHLYWKDDDGTVHTNSKELYRGVPGAIYISHGEWSDPEILYNNHEINYWDAEESLWNSYESDCEEANEKPTKDGFEKWVNELGVGYVESTLDELVWALDGCNESKVNESALNEYQLGDLTKRVGAGLSTLTGNKGNLSQRFQNAKANFKTQGEINDLNELLMKLQKYVDMKVFSPNATIADLIGNKWMKKGDKQGIKQRAGGLRGNIKQRGGQWH